MDTDFYNLCVKTNQKLQKEYADCRASICSSYKREFVVLEGFFDFSLELGAMLDACIPQPEKPYLQFALLRIHENAVKISREAKVLMEYGSASGAIARWRTLFEFSVVANYLLKYPELVEKYIEYVAVDDYKCAKKLLQYRERLNLQNYNMNAFSEIESNYKRVLAKYGWNGKSDYEWAKNEDVKCPNLFKLAEAVEMEHLYAYVDEAHKYNHPSMRYLLADRGRVAPNDDNKYLFSPFDIELPLQLVASSLHQVNCVAIKGYIQLDSVDSQKLMRYAQQNSEFPETLIALIMQRD